MIVTKLVPVIAVALALLGSGSAAQASAIPAVLPTTEATPIQTGWAPLSISDLVLRRPAPSGVREVEVPGLPDTAMAEMSWTGPVILYNPELFRAAGGAREFVRAHELAHILLSHLENERMLNTDEGRAEAEAEADCYAAKSSSPSSVMAMVKLLLRRPPESRDAIYGTKPERARRIMKCAGISHG
jgi:hypothetical protein